MTFDFTACGVEGHAANKRYKEQSLVRCHCAKVIVATEWNTHKPRKRCFFGLGKSGTQRRQVT
jgi:hypothetical protein